MSILFYKNICFFHFSLVYMDFRKYTIFMAVALKQEEELYSYSDVLKWDEDFRAELFNGEMVMMPPPSSIHQYISMELSFQIRRYLEGKVYKIFAAPFAVRLFPQKDRSDDTVFEPDIVVICDPEKIDDKGCNGPPDFVIEIISPSSAKYDRIYKFRKYQKAGVREYWIVDPETKSVQACILDNDRYVMTVYDETEKAPVSVLNGCEINLRTVFAE